MVPVIQASCRPIRPRSMVIDGLRAIHERDARDEHTPSRQRGDEGGDAQAHMHETAEEPRRFAAATATGSRNEPMPS
jgi:hypothetical protein